MRYKFSYENNRGQIINLSEHPFYLDIEPMFDYQWSYSQKEKRRGNIIAGFAKDIKDVDLTLHIMSKTIEKRDEAIDNFNNLIEADIYDGIAGKIWCGDWYTRGYIIASKNNKWQYGNPIIKKNIKFVREQENWWHVIRAANFGEQDESAVSIEEDYIKTYEGRDAGSDIKSLTATIVPQQSGSGTPSPDNVREISGWESVEVVQASRNLFNGSYDVMYKLPEPIPKGTWVTASAKTSGNTQIFYYDIDGSYIDYYTLNATDPTDSSRRYRTFRISPYESQPIPYYIRFTTATATDMQFELSSENALPTPYEVPTTHTTSLGRTVYGGTVDVVSGELVDNMKVIDLGSLNWTLNGTYPIFYAILTDSYTSSGQISTNVYSSQYTVENVAWYQLTNNHMVLSKGLQLSGVNSICIRDDRFTSAADFKSAMDGVQLCYELSTPTTYTLTPQTINTLAGVNNVWADSGNVTVTFRDDHGDIQTESGSIVTFEKKNALSGSGYDYAYDYMRDVQNQKRIVNPSSLPCDFVVNIQGYVDRPEIQIGQNVISVDVEVPYGAVLMIDSSNKTAIMRLANGELVNVFGARNPDYYLFEKIKSGKNIVSWNGSYLWEINMLEERSEPRWLMD